MPLQSRRKAKREQKAARKAARVEGGGDTGEQQMGNFIYSGAVRTNQLAQSFTQFVSLAATAVVFHGLWHCFEADDARFDRTWYARAYFLSNAVVAGLVGYCMRAPGKRGTLFRRTGFAAAGQIVFAGVAWHSLGVPATHVVPLGPLLYAIVWGFWKMLLTNSLQMEHAQLNFQLMAKK